MYYQSLTNRSTAAAIYTFLEGLTHIDVHFDSHFDLQKCTLFSYSMLGSIALRWRANFTNVQSIFMLLESSIDQSMKVIKYVDNVAIKAACMAYEQFP